jgi:hypothetical protein
MKQGTAKEEGHEDKHILDPLLRADQAHQGGEAFAVFYFILCIAITLPLSWILSKIAEWISKELSQIIK